MSDEPTLMVPVNSLNGIACRIVEMDAMTYGSVLASALEKSGKEVQELTVRDIADAINRVLL